MSLQEKPVCRLSARLRCGSLVGPLCSPLPQSRLWPIPAFGRTHLKLFPYRADPCCWLARCKRSASGLSYQWWHHCMTHRERTSCSTRLLLFFPASNSSHCIVFFSLLLFHFCFVAVRKRCGLTSGPHRHIVLTPSECTLDYSPLPLFRLLITCSVAIMDVVTRTLCLWG